MTEEERRAVDLFNMREAGVHPDWARWFVRPGATQQDVRAVIALARHYNNPPQYHVVINWLKDHPN